MKTTVVHICVLTATGHLKGLYESLSSQKITVQTEHFDHVENKELKYFSDLSLHYLLNISFQKLRYLQFKWFEVSSGKDKMRIIQSSTLLNAGISDCQSRL